MIQSRLSELKAADMSSISITERYGIITEFMYMFVVPFVHLLLKISQDRKSMTESKRRTCKVHIRLYEYQSVVHPS